MGSANNPDLGTALNASLRLRIDSSQSRNTYRAIPCSSVPEADLPGGSVLSIPTAPPTRGSRTTPATP